MNKKKIPTTAITSELAGASLFFAKPKESSPSDKLVETPPKSVETTQESKMQVKQTLDIPRDNSRDISRDISLDNPRDYSREKPRELLRDLPTRDDIQEFSFRLRDSIKVKIQAEIPYQWQDHLENIANQLDVKKLELYRFIIGNFLGEVKLVKKTENDK